ncbi:hypothetical protein TOTORO_01020 [Serratia phage vB_SmaS-Totoro]|nr:hypothetical protein TOTORO_01020 [Serratia phage vB_SmaS-Totoro]
MYFDGAELRERFIADLNQIAEDARNSSSHDQVGVAIKSVLEYLDGTHKLSINPITLSFDPMEQDKINRLMMEGEQIIECPISINTGEHLSSLFKVKRDDPKSIHE